MAVRSSHAEQKQYRRESVYDALLNRLASGELGPGARLPSEDRLAAEFGVSRVTVRKVHMRLRTEGHIVSRRGAGSFVAGKCTHAPDGELAAQALEDCMAFRLAIEPGCAALLAERSTEDEVKRLAGCHAALTSAARINDPAAFEAADFSFHQQLARMSGNAYFAGAIAQNAYMVRRTQCPSATLTPEALSRRLEEIIAEHAEILAAIKEHSSTAASEAMKQHLSNARRHMRHAPPGQA